ncbi:MAG: YncE family protein [Flavisolibacter sp.]
MKIIYLLVSFFLALNAWAQPKKNYHVVRSYPVAGSGGWDYIAVHQGRLYISHASRVNILEEATGDSAGVIEGTTGVHGIAFADSFHKGYTSNGRLNNVTVFEVGSDKVITQVATGRNPDAIMFEPFTKSIITCNGGSKDLSLIDPASDKVVGTIPLPGKPEEAVADGKGLLFVNLEDKGEIAVIDLHQQQVIHQWSLQGAEGPTGLAYDAGSDRLFAGCEGFLVIVDARKGTVIKKVPIGEGCDGVVFDSKKHIVFTSNGRSGNITAVKEEGPDQYLVLGNFETKRSARTIALNQVNGRLYLPAADLKITAPNERPSVIPGTFQILVVSNEK